MSVGSVTVQHIPIPDKRSNRFVVMGKVDGIPCRILLDSGASTTVVKATLVNKHKIIRSSKQLLAWAGDSNAWCSCCGNSAD